jgi:predicted Rossmann fold flavoprotein
VDALRSNRKVEIAIDLKPALSEQKLRNRLLRDFERRADEPMSSLLRGLLPRQLVRVCLRACGIRGSRPGRSISEKEQESLRKWLKDFRLSVTGHRPWGEAIITAGGVALSEVNQTTMESKLVRGLYLVGELLDIQADTGGYNLQAAFSSGRLAGIYAARQKP